MPYTCKKTFDCVSTAHRNWRAASNMNRDSKKCSYIHGYTKTFDIVFGCNSLDEFNWVYDYGTTSTGEERTMTSLKKFINETLDHGVTTDSEDPMLSKLYEMHDLELIKLFVIPVENGQSGSIEGLCRYIYNEFDNQIRRETNNRVWIESVTVHEHHKNSSTYTRETESVAPTLKESIAKQIIHNDNLHNETYHKVQEDLKATQDAFDKFEKTPTQDEDFLDKFLTKENLKRGLTLLQFHPKYKVLATSLLALENIVGDTDKLKDIKNEILKNPLLLELIKKGLNK